MLGIYIYLFMEYQIRYVCGMGTPCSPKYPCFLADESALIKYPNKFQLWNSGAHDVIADICVWVFYRFSLSPFAYERRDTFCFVEKNLWHIRHALIWKITRVHVGLFFVLNLLCEDLIQTFIFSVLCFCFSSENKFAVGSGAKTVCICYYEQENNW